MWMDDLSVIFMLGGAVILIVLVVLIALYIVSSLSIFRLLKIYGYQNAWIAWIPIINQYALGDVAITEEKVKIGTVDLPAFLFKFWWIGAFILGYIPEIGTLAALAVQIFFFGTVLTRIYATVENRPEKDVRIVGYLSGWIPLIAYIKFLLYGKDRQIRSADAGNIPRPDDMP